jgi:hypothetical protein
VGALIAIQALAATTTWSGAGNTDPVFKVSFKKVSGHPAHVRAWNSKQLHFKCTDNTTFRSNTTINTPIAVHSGSFLADQLLHQRQRQGQLHDQRQVREQDQGHWDVQGEAVARLGSDPLTATA